MSEAHAKLHLRDFVRTDDVDFSINMMLESFLQSQKVSVSRQLSKKFEKYKNKKTDSTQLMLHTLKKVVSDRAQYNRVVQGIDVLEKLVVRVPQSLF